MAPNLRRNPTRSRPNTCGSYAAGNDDGRADPVHNAQSIQPTTQRQFQLKLWILTGNLETQQILGETRASKRRSANARVILDKDDSGEKKDVCLLGGGYTSSRSSLGKSPVEDLSSGRLDFPSQCQRGGWDYASTRQVRSLRYLRVRIVRLNPTAARLSLSLSLPLSLALPFSLFLSFSHSLHSLSLIHSVLYQQPTELTHSGWRRAACLVTYCAIAAAVAR